MRVWRLADRALLRAVAAVLIAGGLAASGCAPAARVTTAPPLFSAPTSPPPPSPRARFPVEAPADEAEAASSTPQGEAPGWLGVALGGPALDPPGTVVTNVLRRSPAALQGLEVGDILLAINGDAVESPAQFSRRIAETGAGGRVNLTLRRGYDTRLLAVKLGKNPGLEGQLRLGFVDAPAPELEGVEVAQGDLGPTLQALRGSVVVLEFWATWCAACRALSPTLNEWHDRYAPAGAQIVAVTMDSMTQAARDAGQLGLRYPVLADPDGATAQLYQAFALPTLYVIDRAGVVRDVSVGFDPARLATLRATLERLISEST